ncbi:hypothetical protein AURDEDRAFT_114950 [Auricularia subglabra TFB-10046 SS5]|nr:hypothetical protein AURDEDRAFT_114950 [Auricularia subglabra TFB-10046 SS5]
MPRSSKFKTVPFSQFLDEEDAPPEPVPIAEPGQIWWALCSIRETVLDVVKDRSVLPLSSTMVSQRRKLSFLEADKKLRPCVVMDVDYKSGFITVVPLCTFGGVPIEEMDQHSALLSISVGSTNPWPQHDSHVLRITPSWPKSRVKACYAIARQVTLPLTSLGDIYSWLPPRRDPAAEQPRRAPATGTPISPRTVQADDAIEVFTVDEDEMDILEEIMKKREALYRTKTTDELRLMNASYDAQLWRTHNARQAHAGRR